MFTSIAKGGIAYFAAVTFLFSLNQMAQAQSEEPLNYLYRTPLLLSLGAASTYTLVSNHLEPDKKQHFGISIAFGAISESILRTDSLAIPQRWKRIALATTIGTLPGLAKEIYDPVFSKGDLLADVVGAFTGAIMSDLIQGSMSHVSITAGGDSMTLYWSMRY